MKVADVIKRLEEDGWYIARTTGSHRQFSIQRHLAALHEEGLPLPEPVSEAARVEVAA